MKEVENTNSNLTSFWSGGFLYNPRKNSVFLHKRDEKTKYNPGYLAFFGGLNEGQKETPEECFQREILEEAGLEVAKQDIIYLDNYMNKKLNTHRFVFYILSEARKEDLVLGEGAGFEWFELEKVFKQKLTEKTRSDLKKFKKEKVETKKLSPG